MPRADATSPTAPAGFWRYHAEAPAGTPSPLREAYAAIAAALHAIDSGAGGLDALATAAAEACRVAELLLLDAADLAHERCLDAIWAAAEGGGPGNCRALVRELRHQVYQGRGDGVMAAAAEPEVEPSKRPGRKPDKQREQIARFVREQRANNVPYRTIAALILDRFKAKYEAESLRNFTKRGPG